MLCLEMIRGRKLTERKLKRKNKTINIMRAFMMREIKMKIFKKIYYKIKM